MKPALSSLIVAVAVIITALIFANAFTNRHKSSDTISVTGLGSKDFTSDLIVWSGTFSRKNINLRDAYAELESDQQKVRNYLLINGVPAADIVFSSVNIVREYDHQYDQYGRISQTTFTGYTLNQGVQIESAMVDKVEEVSRKVTELINTGVEFYSNQPEYYYTKLSELKIEMIAAATSDARHRATEIAENAGASLGSLKSADMGVFQIIAQNSSEDFSWGGSFNTTSKRKTATVTVKLRYETN